MAERLRFTWDTPLQGLESGPNSLVLGIKVPLHLAGMYQPPFVYRP